MLYFTETGWTLPDMPEISDRFDRDYDQDEYEEKIAKLVKSAANRAKKTSKDEYKQWWAAVRLLRRQDHYIVLLIDGADLRPPGDLLKLWGTALTIVGFVVGFAIVSSKYHIDWDQYLSNQGFQKVFWGTVACLVALYVAARVLFGTRLDNWLIESIFRVKSDGAKK